MEYGKMRKAKEKARKLQAREKKSIVNHYAPGANCQVFNGNISGCIFAMPGANVTQQVTSPATPDEEGQPDEMQDESAGREASSHHRMVPRELKSQRAEGLMDSLIDARMLDEDWQPKGLSGTQRALVARAVSNKLGIYDVWKVFGRLWNMKPETLRSLFNKALDQKQSLVFQGRLAEFIS